MYGDSLPVKRARDSVFRTKLGAVASGPSRELPEGKEGTVAGAVDGVGSANKIGQCRSLQHLRL